MPEVEKAAGWAAATTANSDVTPLAGLGWSSGWGSTDGRGRGGDAAGVEGSDAEGERVGEGAGDGSAGYVEFLPVEWFEEVRRGRPRCPFFFFFYVWKRELAVCLLVCCRVTPSL